MKESIDYEFMRSFTEVLEDEKFKTMVVEEKINYLVEMIESEVNNYKNLINLLSFKDNNIDNCSNIVKKDGNSKSKKDLKKVELGKILECNTLEEMIKYNLLPHKRSPYFRQEMKMILISLRQEIEEYEKIKYEDKEDSLKELREKHYYILDLLNDYNMYDLEDVEIEMQSDFHVIFLPNDSINVAENSLSPIIKDFEKNNKKDNLLMMIDSIRRQEFRGLKRFSDNFSKLYELRYKQERVVFSFVTNDVAVIIYCFTKKDDNSRKYRTDLYNRLNKYLGMKNEIRKIMKDKTGKKEIFLSNQETIRQKVEGNGIGKELIKK